MLAKYQATKLENLQKIYRYDKSYEELLTEADLKTLEERREVALLKFAKKTAKIRNLLTGFRRMITDGVRGILNLIKNCKQGVRDCIVALCMQ